MPRLSAIFIYPIKSVTGIQVNAWEVTETGLKYDRQWMLIDSQQQFLSQRHTPKMTLIKTQIKGQQLIVSAPEQKDLTLSLEPAQNLQTVTATVWDDQCTAQLIGSEADQWFSDFLQIPCRLVHQAKTSIRTVNQKYALANDQTAFSDGFPFLITSEASLALLNQQMGLDLSMQRFRPNLVIADCASYAEDTWRKISIGTVNFRLPKPCSRCSVPQIDPETAINNKEPLRTLSRTRKWQSKVYFGQNALHDQQGQLQINDLVNIIEIGPAQPPL
ncbi:MAG: MOSC domain-containing protein [Methyloprofundus sp.]|nr:MOSC domain-containing protein [Methyloprofundus sp.]MBW6452649.1 MOSC domain-containing protein [Methyloprofundus sp.]